MMTMGPPELMPVTRPALMPNQEFVNAKPTPNIDQTVKSFFMPESAGPVVDLYVGVRMTGGVVRVAILAGGWSRWGSDRLMDEGILIDRDPGV